MWKPLIRSTLIGGIVVFLWFMISWMIFPFHKATMRQFIDETKVTEVILEQAPTSGIYAYPSMDYDENKKIEPKAFIFVNLKKDIDFTRMAAPMVVGLITQFIGAFLITGLMLKAKVSKYWDKVWFATIIGAIIGFLGLMPFFNWWHFPGSWVFATMIDYVIAWFLGGLVIGKLSKR